MPKEFCGSLFEMCYSCTKPALQVLFDPYGVLRKYDTAEDILKDFFKVRLEYYQKRKDYLTGLLAVQCLKDDNIVRFITEKIDGTIVVGKECRVTCLSISCRRLARQFKRWCTQIDA